MATTILGTSLTMAPEVLEGKKYGLEADIYRYFFYFMLIKSILKIKSSP